MQVLWDICAVLYLAAYLLAGVRYSSLLLPREGRLVRISTGISLGLFAQMWLPALFSFVMGFALPSQLLGLTAFLLPLWFLRKKRSEPTDKEDALALRLHFACVVPAMALCAYLLYTHVLRAEDGALYTGQSCYGDICMHLPLITSIARSGVFPPNYPIEAGVKMGYPFLCDSISSTYAVLGARLKLAYILPMVAALYAVFSWYFLLMNRFLRSPKRAALAYALFFLGGGLGLSYFLDGAKAFPENFTRIFTAFYETPTNNVADNVLWVNPIADLLIPQRATLFGWSILLPCLYLLYRLAFEEETRYSVYLGVLAGGLPLLHAHSFMALGMISACAVVHQLWVSPKLKSVLRYLPYLGIALLFSLPQLICFTFAQVGNSHFLHFGFNWINKEDPYFWFYIKNIGLVFVLLPFALLSEKRLRGFWLCALPLWVICEFIIFQPNDYDNNKLLYVVHMLSCGVVASFLATLWHKLHGLPGRAALGTLILAPGLLAGTLTLIRETVSDYQLFSAPEVAAARFAGENLPVDAILLTADEHNNPFACLSGFTIVQGSPSFLYFHGIYDTDRAADVTAMYTQEGALEELAGKYGITHVVLSEYEYNLGADAALFEDLPVVFSSHGVTIYSLK